MDNSRTSLKMLLADTFCFGLPAPAIGCCEGFLMVLLLSEFSKYSVINFSNAAISSNADWLISDIAATEFMLQSLMLLELLDFLELAVDWLDWLESVLVDPMERELDCLGKVL